MLKKVIVFIRQVKSDGLICVFLNPIIPLFFILTSLTISSICFESDCALWTKILIVLTDVLLVFIVRKKKFPFRRSQQTFLVFQDVFKTSWRRLQRNTFRLSRHIFAIRLPKTSSRRVCSTSCNYVFNTSTRRLQDILEDKKMLPEDVFKTSSPRRIIAGLILKKCIFIYLYCRFFKFPYTIKIIVRFYLSECSIYLPLLSQIKVNNTLL